MMTWALALYHTLGPFYGLTSSSLTDPYDLTSVCIFSILFSIHFLRCQQGEFVSHSRALVAAHFLNTRDLNV